MKSTTWRRLAVGVALAGVVAGSAACKTPGNKPAVRSDRPPAERKVDPKKARQVQIRVWRAEGPYTLTVVARNETGGGTDRTGPLEIAGGPYTQTLDYDPGVRVVIHVEAYGHANDMFECEIADGPETDSDRGRGAVSCSLVTSR